MTNREYLIQEAMKSRNLACIISNIENESESIDFQVYNCWERFVCKKVCDGIHPNVSEEHRHDFCNDCPVFVSFYDKVQLWLETEADQRFWEDFVHD